MKRWFEEYKVCSRKAGALTWPSRLLILFGFFGLGAGVAICYADNVIDFLLRHNQIIDQKNHIFSSAVTLGLFGVIFGLGNWIIKNHDVQKQFQDTFIGQNELLFSNAVKALFDKSFADEKSVTVHRSAEKLPVGWKAINAYGLREIARLAHDDLIKIKKKRFDAVTTAGLDLSGANLQNAELMRLNLQFVQLTGASLKRADLREVDFRNSNLTQTIMSYANSRNADLRQAVLHGTDFTGADLREANFSRTELLKVNLSGTVLRGANLSRVKLEARFIATDLRGANLSGADLSGADLRETRLTGAELSDANLRGADLRGVDLSGADLSGVDLQGASYDQFTNFPAGFDPNNTNSKRSKWRKRVGRGDI